MRVWLDRLIAEPAGESGSHDKAHLLSVFGGDQDIAAVSAAIAEKATFEVNAPGIPRLQLFLGDNPDVFRGSTNIPGRKRPVRHLVAVSNEFALTRHGGDMQARRTVLASDDPEFMLYRIGIRFGLPVLPEWSEWFTEELARHRAVRTLIGLGCRPVVVTGTKKRFLGWIGHALKRKRISIPAEYDATPWRVPSDFGGASGDRGEPAETPPRRIR